jgi:transposase InsO family protein
VQAAHSFRSDEKDHGQTRLAHQQKRRANTQEEGLTRRLRAMGIRDKPTAAGSPWQNAYAERLLGSIRRECVDHLIVLGETHLRRILAKYAAYYNESRTHRSLNKDAPFHRTIQRMGAITSQPVLGAFITNIAESNFR